jgi:hypothetical protein
MTTFLPDDYKVPSNSNYMKFETGENTFRILSSAIIGFEYWNKDNKPVRSRTPWDEIPADIKPQKDGSIRINHFWAFIVWNYNESRIQILELTQKSIMEGIKALVDNKKWGDPKGFDITVTKVGEGLNTEYTVMPNPHSPMPDDAIKGMETKKITLAALYDGKDPFATE